MGAHESFWNLLPAMVLGGIGMAAAMPPTTAAAMQSVRPDKAGVGSAVLNSMRQVGGSLGIALMGAIVAASVTPGEPNPTAFLDGFHHALLAGAGLAAPRRRGRGADAQRQATRPDRARRRPSAEAG